MKIRNEEGFALIAAILANMILLAVGIIAINISTQDLRISMRVVGDKKAMSAAEAASHWVIMNLNPDNPGSVVKTNQPLNELGSELTSRSRITITQPAPPTMGPLFMKMPGYDMSSNQWILLRYNTTITGRNDDYQASVTVDLGLGYGPVDATSY
jgi:Tfp pilus assembly protein PilX